jgi:hypothetical protein
MLRGVLTQNYAGVTHFAVSETGTLVYIPGKKIEDSPTLSRVDASGKIEPVPQSNEIAVTVRISPDGERMLEGRSWIADEAILGIHELKRNIFRRLCRGAAFWGVWSPDGRLVAHNEARTPDGEREMETWAWDKNLELNLFLTPTDGSGASVRLTKSDKWQVPYSFSSDGKTLAFQAGKNPDGEGWEVWMLDMASRKAYPFVTGGRSNVHPALSPDGRWVAYATKESGRWEVMVRAFPGPGAVSQVSTEGGWEPLWTPDGKTLVYRTLDGKEILGAAFQPGTPPKLEAPRVLVQGAFWPGMVFGRMYDLAPDGKRFYAMAMPEPIPKVDQYVVVLNWVEELKRLMP